MVYGCNIIEDATVGSSKQNLTVHVYHSVFAVVKYWVNGRLLHKCYTHTVFDLEHCLPRIGKIKIALLLIDGLGLAYTDSWSRAPTRVATR